MVETKDNNEILAEFFNVTKDVIDSSKFNPNKFAVLIKDTFLTKSMIDNDEILLFIDGHYKLNGEIEIKTLCDRLLQENYKEGFYHRVCNKIIAASPRINRDIEEPNNKINVANGIIDISSIYDNNIGFDIHNMKLLDHNSNYNFLYRLNINFNPDADCPKIKKFLRSSVGTDDDYKCLQEIFGFLLYPTYKFDKMFIFFGETRSHKTTISSGLMRTFIGDENTSNIKLHKLHERFAAENLYGKKLNVCSEISSKTLEDPDAIKDLLGFEKIFADVKTKKGINFYNRAKIVGSSNNLPDVDTSDDALMKKIILINFPNDFSEEDTERVLKELTTPEELSGLLNLAIEGLERLIKNNKFTYDHNTTGDRWDEYRAIKNPLNDFFEQWFEFGADKSITKEFLYKLYELNCLMAKTQPITENKFSRTINDIYGKKGTNQILDFRPKIGECRPKSWAGVDLKTDVAKALEKASEHAHIITAIQMDINEVDIRKVS